jgi:hypothetical protein
VHWRVVVEAQQLEMEYQKQLEMEYQRKKSDMHQCVAISCEPCIRERAVATAAGNGVSEEFTAVQHHVNPARAAQRSHQHWQELLTHEQEVKNIERKLFPSLSPSMYKRVSGSIHFSQPSGFDSTEGLDSTRVSAELPSPREEDRFSVPCDILSDAPSGQLAWLEDAAPGTSEREEEEEEEISVEEVEAVAKMIPWDLDQMFPSMSSPQDAKSALTGIPGVPSHLNARPSSTYSASYPRQHIPTLTLDTWPPSPPVHRANTAEASPPVDPEVSGCLPFVAYSSILALEARRLSHTLTLTPAPHWPVCVCERERAR